MAKPSRMLEGRRVKLLRCNNQCVDAALGSIGTVTSVNDDGTLHVCWDDGGVVGLVWDDGDRWEVIP